jgi:hypothetical protein
MKEFVLDWDIMKTWPPILWAVFFSLITFLLTLFIVIFHYYLIFDLELIYLFWGIGLLLYFLYMGRNAKDTHIHHYVLAMIVLSFLGYQSKFLTIAHGIFTGIMIEGGSRWGYDPIWTY